MGSEGAGEIIGVPLALDYEHQQRLHQIRQPVQHPPQALVTPHTPVDASRLALCIRVPTARAGMIGRCHFVAGAVDETPHRENLLAVLIGVAVEIPRLLAVPSLCAASLHRSRIGPLYEGCSDDLLKAADYLIVAGRDTAGVLSLE